MNTLVCSVRDQVDTLGAHKAQDDTVDQRATAPVARSHDCLVISGKVHQPAHCSDPLPDTPQEPAHYLLSSPTCPDALRPANFRTISRGFEVKRQLGTVNQFPHVTTGSGPSSPIPVFIAVSSSSFGRHLFPTSSNHRQHSRTLYAYDNRVWSLVSRFRLNPRAICFRRTPSASVEHHLLPSINIFFRHL